MPDYLCYFAQVHQNFRLPELQALSDLFKGELMYVPEEYSDEVGPFKGYDDLSYELLLIIPRHLF
jgi:tRNA G10  N-methylase Trm11